MKQAAAAVAPANPMLAAIQARGGRRGGEGAGPPWSGALAQDAVGVAG